MAFQYCPNVYAIRVRAIALACLCATAFSMVGCATFWDEITSKERDWSFATGYGKPHPLVTIQNTTDGARRAQALSELKEPLANGGTAQDQAAYLRILGTAAQDDPLPLCRLAAIRSLGRFKDPKAARMLEDVYQQRNMHPISMPEQIAMIRKEALVALEQTGDKDARPLLIRVARQPGPPIESNLLDRQQTQDEKLVAIRALAKFNDAESIEALKFVMRTEKDVALRDRALQSLEETTGKQWPLQREAWQREDAPPQPIVREKSTIERVGAWFPK